MTTKRTKPRYTLIRGNYYILYPDLPKNGPQPDGDTINFLPDNESLVTSLRRFSDRPPERKHLGTYSVRFEAIDALETHFMNRHQKLDEHSWRAIACWSFIRRGGPSGPPGRPEGRRLHHHK
jgi:hypothetical protein